jgi:hypothetical protein
MIATLCTERLCDPTEHRWGRRIELELPVKLALGGRALGRGTLRSVSLSGALIETAVELAVFTNLAVTLPGTDAASADGHTLAATVVRRETGGIAVEWRDMGCAALVALLERITGQDASTLRDDEAFTSRRTPC